MNKKQFILRFGKIAIFCLIFSILFSKFYKILSWKEGTAPYVSAATTLYEDLEDNTADVLFLGSSHCYASINNTKLYDDYGIGAFNMVISGQDLASSYYYMQEVFKTQNPKIVCVELYGATFENHAVTANIYRNALSFKNNKNFYNVVNAIAPKEDKNDYLLRWPIIHTRYKELQKGDFCKPNIPYLGGNSYGTHITDINELYIYKGNDIFPISKQNEYFIKKFVEFSKEKNFQLCFFVVPFDAGKETQQQFKFIEQKYCGDNIKFVNFFDIAEELNIDPHTDFSDSGHTNQYGAEKITTYMGNYLKNNYDIPDRRGDEKYHFWQANSKAAKHQNISDKISKIYNISDYFYAIDNLSDHTIIIASNGDYMCDDINIKSDLINLGIDSDFITNGGVRIIQNKKIIYSADDDSLDSFYLDVPNAVLSVKKENGSNNIYFNRTNCKKVDNGFNILIYDNFTGKISDIVGFNSHNLYDGDH